MCGATSAQNQLQAEDLQTLQQYDQAFQQEYANNQAIYNQVSSVLQPIIAAGPNQTGFSEGEENTLNAQAVEGTAENYSSASKAINEKMAGEGGGTNPLPSGAQSQEQAQIATSAAETESNEETQIEEANYSTGRQDFENALQGEMAVASGQNPLGYASATTSAEGAAGTEAEQIANENNSWYTAAMGAAGQIGGAVVNQNPGDIFG